MPLNPKILIPLIIIAIVAYSSVFTVNQWEQALVFKFREIVRSDDKPGLHFMLPVVNKAQKFEKRLLNLDQEPQRFITIEKKYFRQMINLK